MRKNFIYLLFFLLIFSCKESKPFVKQHKVYTSIITDSSNIFTQNQRDSLTSKIIQFENETTNEIAIVTFDSIDNNIAVFTSNLANKIGVGKKEKNNGLLILLVIHQRKVWISTGYGTEKILTDSICKLIIDDKMIPQFSKGEFYKGIDLALDELMKKWTND